MKTNIFLDSGDPQETRSTIEKLGFLDGQTTNPSLIVKNPEVQKCKTGEKQCSEEDLLLYYKDIVMELRTILNDNQSISIEVYSDKDTTAEEMVAQGEEMNTWISGAHIKLPITKAGLVAARYFIDRGINVNMTLCFSVEQALAVHEATVGCREGQVFISPFIGRLDDIGESGIDLVKNILDSYHTLNSNVKVLAASIRTKEHVADAIALGCDCMTIPYKVLARFEPGELDSLLSTPRREKEEKDIEDLSPDNIEHELTSKGLAQFASDWKSIFTTSDKE